MDALYWQRFRGRSWDIVFIVYSFETSHVILFNENQFQIQKRKIIKVSDSLSDNNNIFTYVFKTFSIWLRQ